MGIKTPVPYRYRKELGGRLKYGLNFAYGGTGVFDTPAPEPNMTTQIDFLQQLLNDSVYSKRALKTSVALVSLAGNDYSNYIATNGSTAVIITPHIYSYIYAHYVPCVTNPTFNDGMLELVEPHL